MALLSFAACLGAACQDKTLRPRVLVAASFHEAAKRVVGEAAIVVPGASSTLARQIVDGAPAGCFVSANPEWMDFVAKRGLLEPGTRRRLVRNEVVVVAPKGKGTKVSWSTFRGRIAMGDPQHVPAGKYGMRALEAEGVWQRISKHVIPASDVRAALTLVERDEVDLAVVYHTDAKASARVEIVHRFVPGKTPAVQYEIALVRGGDRELLRRLTNDDAKSRYRELGFLPVPR